MACNLIKKSKALKKFCLKRRVKKLKNKIDNEIQSIIFLYPKEVARMDNIENNFPSSALPRIKIELSATQKLLAHISKN